MFLFLLEKLITLLKRIKIMENVEIEFLEFKKSYKKFIETYLPYYEEEIQDQLLDTLVNLDLVVLPKIKDILELQYQLKIDNPKMEFPINLPIMENDLLIKIDFLLYKIKRGE